MLLRNNSSLLLQGGAPKVSCNARIINTDINRGLLEGLCWMLVAVVSSTLNANALYSVQNRFKSKKVHRIYLNNVFICNFSIGNISYLSYVLIKYGSKMCWLRDVCFVSTIVLTNVHQLSMICILFFQLRKTVKIHVLSGPGSKTLSLTMHMVAVASSWFLSMIIVMIMVVWPTSVFSLVFTVVKVICIVVLAFNAIKFIRKGISLRTKSPGSRNSDADSTRTAMTIMTSFLLITVITWLPLLVMLTLQKSGVVTKKNIAPYLLTGVRIVGLGPLADPIFYFWSKRTKKVPNTRT